MSYVDELRAGEGGNLTKDINHASFSSSRDWQSWQLLLHFVGDTVCPAAHLVIDEPNILLALLKALKLDLQLLVLVLQVRILRLFGLHNIIRGP